MKKEKAKRRNANAHGEAQQKPPGQFPPGKDIPTWFDTGERICVLVVVVCGLMASGMSDHKLPLYWTIGIGLCAAIIGTLLWYTDKELRRREAIATLNELDKPAPPALIVPKPAPSQTPIPSPTPTTPSPAQTLVATPEHRVASLSLKDAGEKLGEAINSPERGKYDAVRNALIGLPVDWTLNFLSADRDSSGKLMQVWLNDPKLTIGLVVLDLPLEGNERLPLMERTDVFRVRGIIEDARVTVFALRDATLEYVRSDPKK